MRIARLAPTFGGIPERRTRDEEDLLITFLTLIAVALGAAGLLAALGAFGGSIDDPAVAPCRRPPTT